MTILKKRLSKLAIECEQNRKEEIDESYICGVLNSMNVKPITEPCRHFRWVAREILLEQVKQ